jgi:hypothetical protein
MLALPLATLAVALFAAAAVPAGEKTGTGDRHDGTVVSVTATKLVMKGNARDGQDTKEHTHLLAESGKVTCDGKACKVEDLKAGQKIRVTTKNGDRTMATRVEALLKNAQFEGDSGNIKDIRDIERR